MKTLTRVAHRIVKKLSLEEFIVSVSRQFSLSRKFLPLPSEYSFNDQIILKRNGIIYDLNRSDYMQWCIFANMDEHIFEIVEDYLSDGILFLDVGSNIGAFSLNIARKAMGKKITGIQILAFEPNPFIAKKFRINMDLNPDLRSMISLYELAVGDKNEKVNILFNPNNSGGGKVSYDQGIQVNMVRFDDYFSEETKMQIGFLKIDVEGFEPKVLEGAEQIIKNYRPVIYMEVTDEWYKMNGSNAQNVINSLKNLNYKLMWETNGAFKSLESLPSAFQFNMLCIPE